MTFRAVTKKEATVGQRIHQRAGLKVNINKSSAGTMLRCQQAKRKRKRKRNMKLMKGAERAPFSSWEVAQPWQASKIA